MFGVGLLMGILFIAGCGTSVQTETSSSTSAAPASSSSDATASARQKLTAAGYQYTESDETNKSRIQTTGGVKSSTRFTLKNEVEVIVTVLNNASETAAVKGQINAQLEALKAFDATAMMTMIDAEDGVIEAVSYSQANAAFAGQVAAALR